MRPSEIRQRVALPLDVANARGNCVRVVRDLVVVAPRRHNEAELIRRVPIKNQRAEAAQTPNAVVQHVRARRLQAVIAAIPVHAAKVSESRGMIAEIELIVGLMKCAKRGVELHLAVSFEPGSRDNVKHAVRAVSILRGIPAALHFQVIDVLGIDLWPHVAGNVRIRYRNSVNGPGNLMSASNVQLVVSHVGARHVAGDHSQAVAQVRAGRLLDGLAAHQRLRRGRLRIYAFRRLGHLDRLSLLFQP